MPFKSATEPLETDEQEQERLARCPEGSINHYLSTLPVTLTEWPQDLVVQLPWNGPRSSRTYRVLVVPIEFVPTMNFEKKQIRIGYWKCAVVSSDHPGYAVGGYRIMVSAAELARGRQVVL